jgi:hypothetical protein
LRIVKPSDPVGTAGGKKALTLLYPGYTAATRSSQSSIFEKNFNTGVQLEEQISGQGNPELTQSWVAARGAGHLRCTSKRIWPEGGISARGQAGVALSTTAELVAKLIRITHAEDSAACERNEGFTSTWRMNKLPAMRENEPVDGPAPYTAGDTDVVEIKM